MKSNYEEAWDDLQEIVKCVISKLPIETRCAPSDVIGYTLEDRLPGELTKAILKEFVAIKK